MQAQPERMLEAQGRGGPRPARPRAEGQRPPDATPLGRRKPRTPSCFPAFRPRRGDGWLESVTVLTGGSVTAARGHRGVFASSPQRWRVPAEELSQDEARPARTCSPRAGGRDPTRHLPKQPGKASEVSSQRGPGLGTDAPIRAPGLWPQGWGARGPRGLDFRGCTQGKDEELPLEWGDSRNAARRGGFGKTRVNTHSLHHSAFPDALPGNCKPRPRLTCWLASPSTPPGPGLSGVRRP